VGEANPLCGTLNYAAGTPGFAVNVAIKEPTLLVAAAVADPLTSELLWTDGASGHSRHGSTDEPLAPSASSGLVDSNLDPPFPSAPAFHCLDLIADAGFSARFRPRVPSSSLALAWVAAGRRAAYVTDGDARDSVHSAAGIAVCLAAKHIVTDLAGRTWPGDSPGLLAAADRETHKGALRPYRCAAYTFTTRSNTRPRPTGLVKRPWRCSDLVRSATAQPGRVRRSSSSRQPMASHALLPGERIMSGSRTAGGTLQS